MLERFTVVDLGGLGPVARCTWILADLGARVIRVAGPGRPEAPSHAYGGGRGVERVEIDLKADPKAFLDLVAGAHVVCESFRPGVADRLGVGYDACRAVNPGVVYCALTGYGQDGPYAAWAGHDLNYLAIGGYLGLQGTRTDGGPALPGATIADAAGGGMQAVIAILAALLRGEGAFLDVSTLEGVLFLTALQVDEHLATGSEPGPGTTLLTGRYACYDVYECADGKWLAVGAIEQRFFANLCAALGLTELAPKQYDDGAQDSLRAALREAFARKDRDAWVRELAPADACVAPVLSVAEVVTDEHVRARGLVGDGRLRPLIAGSRS